MRLEGAHLPWPCVVNRLGCGACITQKNHLTKSLRRSGQTCLAPLTFNLPDDGPQLLHHCKGFRLNSTGPLPCATWIVKPVKAGCGRGIFVTRRLDEHVRPGDLCVVSQYIDRPLLVHGKKLDLRLFVLVLSDAPRNVRRYLLNLKHVAKP